MQKNIHIACASINTTALDVEKNAALILQACHKAIKQQVDILLLPELVLSGYGCEDMFFSTDWLKHIEKSFLKLVNQIPNNLLVALGLPVIFESHLYNAAALISKGRIHGIACKQHLANDGIHYEKRWFSSWQEKQLAYITLGEQTVPLGSPIFSVDNFHIGFEICEDAWQENRLGQQLHQQGIDIILNPSASHFALEKEAIRENIVKSGAKLFDVAYVYCNLIGCEAGRAIYDGDNMIALKGNLVMRSTRFQHIPVTFDSSVLTLEAKKHKISKQDVTVDFIFPNKQKANASPLVDIYEQQLDVLAHAIALGLWDWQRKTLTKGFTVSLSGGADSALCAAMVYFAQAKALMQLGSHDYIKVLEQTGVHIDETFKKSPNLINLKKYIMPQVLTTVYQASKNSSQTTMNAANTLAKALGAKHFIWSIDNLVNEYTHLVEKTIKHRHLNWQEDDISLQNIQARARSPGIWLLANVSQQLLLATSNLSEASVGYCTMDGDTSGVLAPIGGLSKSLILKLNQFLATEGIYLAKNNDEKFVLAALECINKQKPTAELRKVTQNDEDDVMPYVILDAIRDLSQVKFLSPLALFQALRQLACTIHYNDKALKIFIQRYFQLYCRNQWKRERLATSFHLQIDSACPKTYRRFPVLNSQFKTELKSLI